MLVINEGILLLFIRAVDPKIVGWTSGEPTSDFYPLSRLESVCLVGGRCSGSFHSKTSSVSSGCLATHREDRTGLDDVSVPVLG